MHGAFTSLGPNNYVVRSTLAALQPIVTLKRMSLYLLT